MEGEEEMEEEEKRRGGVMMIRIHWPNKESSRRAISLGERSSSSPIVEERNVCIQKVTDVIKKRREMREEL